MKSFMKAVVAAACVGLVATACDVHGISSPGTLANIVVSPDPQTLAINGTQQFTATGTDFSGAKVTFTPVWTAATGGTISANGMFTAGTVPGTFTKTVTATSGGVSASATVVVTPGPLATIVVTPNPATLAVGATQQFTAVGKDASGNVVVLTPTWSVVAGGGTISATGLFTAGTVSGAFANTVQASSNGIKATATVNVTPGPLATITVTPNPITMNVGITQQFTAVGKDANGNVIPITPVWSVVASGGTIDSVSGVFTAGNVPGTFTNTVKATSGTISGLASVTVTAGPLATITVTPSSVALAIGGVQQFSAVGRDAGGNVIPISPVWAVVAGGGSIDLSSGLFTAGNTVGTFANTVRASVGTIAGFASVTVSAGGLVSITVTPNPVALQTGGTQQFTATGRDAGGNAVSITPTWSVVNGGGTITPADGLFTAGNTVGTFTNTVRANVGTIEGFASVSVSAGVLASITVTPNPATLQTGATQQFSATGRDAGGNLVAITPTWSVVNGGGTITPAGGLFTGTTPGTFPNTVVATVGGVTGTATVTVTPVLATIIVTPNPVILLANATQQFAAVGLDQNGNNFAISPVWAVVNGGGTIDPNTGVFTAGSTPGTFVSTVRATSGGKAGFATVTVTNTAPVLATITVTPNPATVVTGGTQQFTAVGRDGNGNVFLITPVWNVVNPAAGTINPVTGLFTAGPTVGSYPNTVRASVGAIAGTATVNETAVPVAPLVDLRTAAPNGIMAGTEVTCVALGTIFADVSISPGGALSGFPPCTITGARNLANGVAAQAQLDLTAAYNTLDGIPCTTTITANLGGTTLAPGVYCSATTVGVTGTVTLDGQGDPNATFLIKAGTGLTTAGNVVLIGQAQAKNVYWLVGSSATLGTASQWQGNIIALTSITLVDNSTILGRALARNGAVTLGTGNVITLP